MTYKEKNNEIVISNEKFWTRAKYPHQVQKGGRTGRRPNSFMRNMANRIVQVHGILKNQENLPHAAVIREALCVIKENP